MASIRNTTRVQVGSESWILEERGSALQIAQQESEEFTFSARNECDWLNEHMAEIFNENQINVTEIFKTPGKLRGKTPRTARKGNPLESRAPLTDIFSATPRNLASPFRQQQQPSDRPAQPKFQVAEDKPEPVSKPAAAPLAHFLDSGYHGSQNTQATQATEAIEYSFQQMTQQSSPAKTPARPTAIESVDIISEERRTTEGSFKSAKEEQTIPAPMEGVVEEDAAVTEPEKVDTPEKIASPSKSVRAPSPQKPLPEQSIELPQLNKVPQTSEATSTFTGEQIFEDVHSPSEGSSPIRQIVRKSSLNFASLPAREPLTTKKSIGNRTSRTSHLEQPRTSYYPRHTDGKSIGVRREESDDEDVDMEEADTVRPESSEGAKATMLHNKTSTQRLQDQISMLGKPQSQPTRPSKSIPNMASLFQAQPPAVPPKSLSPIRTEPKQSAPGAFPEDEEDSWIGPPTATAPAPSVFSPRPERPPLPHSHTTAVMENIRPESSVFTVPKQRSPLKEAIDRFDSPRGHMKAASTSIIRSPNKDKELADLSLKKAVSVSNPNMASALPQASPPKSPSRSLRDSPLKAAKDKITSMFKASRGLLASSAAASADAYASVLSPPSIRPQLSFDDVLRAQPSRDELTYPSLSEQPASPTLSRKTRASTEKEEKRKEKEAKEARVMQDQLNKLEKMREKESQKARVFSQEQERVAAMKKQMEEKKEQERLAKAAQTEAPRPTRSSPRKTKAQLEAEGRAAAVLTAAEAGEKDIEMTDASSMAPPPAPRPGTSGTGQTGKEPGKRTIKPTIQPPSRGGKPAAAPLHIRVHTGAHGGPHRSQMNPSNSALAAGLGESLVSSSVPLNSSQTAGKATTPGHTLGSKVSTSSMSSLKSATSSKKLTSLATAARKKEEDERNAQRRQDLKLENQRKRAAEEEERKQEQLRLEAEKKREQREKLANQKTQAQRQALEKAKNERPPPPPARSQRPDQKHDTLQDKPLPPAPTHRDAGPSRPVSRMNTARPQEDFSRSQGPVAQNMSKQPPKRPLPQDTDDHPRPQLQRNGPSYTHAQNPDKRRRTGEDLDEMSAEPQQRPGLGAPIRQSNIRQKDIQSKSIFQNSGYANVPGPPHGGQNLLQQATRPTQTQSKPMHPMDMAHTSKAPINFAPHPNTHKTPARPLPIGGKSTGKPSAKSSPRYQNGENIELPEIHTDSEEEDSDDGDRKDFNVPDWVDSPNLRAGLIAQELIDPVSVFGRPTDLKMEEVFKNKERWQKFRQRTSSANWSGTDRLTEEDIRKDLAAKEKMRRDGGWSYGVS